VFLIIKDFGLFIKSLIEYVKKPKKGGFVVFNCFHLMDLLVYTHKSHCVYHLIGR